MEPLLLVSGDGHLGAPPDTYRPYFDPAYRDLFSEFEAEQKWFRELVDPLQSEIPADVDTEGAHRAGGVRGSFDIARRMKELDREGVVAEVVFPGTQLAISPFFSVVSKEWPADVRAAGVRAYHRWAADCFAESKGRTFGVAEPGPCVDMKDEVAAIAWCADHNFRSMQLPGNTADPALPPITSSYYEPFWAACAETGLVLAAHAGYNHVQGHWWEFAKAFLKNVVGGDSTVKQQPNVMMQAFEAEEDSPFKLDMAPRRAIWQLMLGGVFDRHPNLKYVITEARADWIPATLRRLDELAARSKTPLKMKPSEYWARNCYVTPSSIHVCEMEMRHEIGVDRLMFGTDYPHPEGTWPNTKDWIRATFKGVPENEARMILGENLIACYGLDRAKLVPIAERIGIAPGEVLGDSHTVGKAHIEHFQGRGGLLREAEQVDNADIDTLFSEDLHRVAA